MQHNDDKCEICFLSQCLKHCFEEKVSNWTNICMRQRCFCSIQRAPRAHGLLMWRPDSENKKRISSTTYGTGIHSTQTATVLMFIFNSSWCFNNLWRATCKRLMWAKSKTCKILDMRRNIKPNPRNTRVFLRSHLLLRFSQRCSMRKVRKRQLGRSLSARRKEGICALLDI